MLNTRSMQFQNTAYVNIWKSTYPVRINQTILQATIEPVNIIRTFIQVIIVRYPR